MTVAVLDTHDQAPERTRGCRGVGLPSGMLTAYLIAVALLALALTRLPSAIRGRNVLVMCAAAAIVLAFTLITPGVYAVLAQLLPVPNLVDLLSKLALFVGLLLAGTQIARAYESAAAQRLIAGVPGGVVFGVLFLTEVTIFAGVYMSAVQPGLEGDLENPWVRVYAAVATAYPAYVGAVLLPPLLRAVSSRNGNVRVTSLLLTLGFGLALVRFVLALVTLGYVPLYPASQIVSGVAAVCVALGLVTAFVGRVTRSRRDGRDIRR